MRDRRPLAAQQPAAEVGRELTTNWTSPRTSAARAAASSGSSSTSRK